MTGIAYFIHVYVPEKYTLKFKDLAEVYQPFLPIVNVVSLIRPDKIAKQSF